MATLFKNLIRSLSSMPLWLLHALGWLLGWLAFVASASYRRHLRANAKQAGLGTMQRLSTVGAAGQLLMELPRLWLGKPVAYTWDGDTHIDAAFASGRGLLFLTPHLGCFEVTAQAYAARYGASKPMTVLFRPPRKAWLVELVSQARARPGLNTAPVNLAGVKQLIKALKARECVGLLPDQVPPLHQGVWADFFGRPAYTMTLAAKLAQQTGAVVLLAWGERLPRGRGYTIHVRPLPKPLDDTLADAVVQINHAMEQLILECPAQYLWGYARYKAPKEEA